MLQELIVLLTSKSVPAARKAGLVSEVASISGRYGQHKDAWTNHIEKTCAAIEKHIPHIDPKKPILVLGAGLCLDIPLATLNRHPAGTVLMDAVYTPMARRQCYLYKNIRFKCHDVTGFLAPFWESKDSEKITLPDNAPLPTSGYSLVVSCNILSQLPLSFAASPPKGDTECRITASIQQAHVRALKAMDCPVLMITDYERLETEGENQSVISTVASALLPGTPTETWQWHIAPKGEVRPGLDVTLNVGCWLLNS